MRDEMMCLVDGEANDAHRTNEVADDGSRIVDELRGDRATEMDLVA